MLSYTDIIKNSIKSIILRLDFIFLQTKRKDDYEDQSD